MKSEVDTAEAIRVATFRTALRAFLQTSEQLAKESGLTPQRHLLLLAIKGAPDGSERATLSEVAERLGLAQSTASELVERAEQAGLVVRARSAADRRVAEIRLSAEGERRLELVFASHRAERQKLLALLRSEV
jgi:DNA-binding MarR family transcriptional regulator